MKIAIRLIAASVIALCCAFEAQAGQDSSTCINIANANLQCNGVDAQGRTMYTVTFSFSWVKPGTNFIRIHEGPSQGSTYVYPFTSPTQSASGKMYWWESPIRCFTIDVYDVLPNGKVVMCSRQYCVFAFCGGGGKDVVAGEITTPSLTLAPNPAMDVVNITVEVPSFDPAASIDIVDMNGNTVATIATAMEAGQTMIPADLPNLPSGSYMVRMQHANGMIVRQLQIVR